MNKLTSIIGYVTAFFVLAVAGILIPKGVYFVVGNFLEVIPRDDFFLYYHNLKFLIPLSGIFVYFLFRQFNYKTQAFKFGWYDSWFIAFTCLVFISAFWAKNPIVTISVGFSWLFLYSVFKFFEDFCLINGRKDTIVYLLLIVLILTLIPVVSFFFITGYSISTGQLSFSSNQLLNIWSIFFTHRNYCSSIIVLFAGLPLYWLYQNKKWSQIIFAIVLLCIIFLSLLLLRSRGSLLAFFVITGIVLTYNFWSKAFSWKVVLICLLLFAAIFKGVIALQHDQQYYLLLLDPLHGVNSLDGDDRLELWQMSLQLFEENPVIGYGAGNWQFEYMKYGAGDLKFTNYTNKYLGHPHNFFVDVLFSNGLIGFALVFIFMIAYPAGIGLKKIFSGSFTKTDFVFFAGITGYWIVAQFYGAVYMTLGNFVGQAVLFFIFTGCIQVRKANIKNFFPAFFMVCICVATVFFHFNSIGMLYNYDLHKKSMTEKNYYLSQFILDKLEKNPLGFLGYNCTMISTNALWFDLYNKTGKPQIALQYLQAMLTKDPYNFNHWFRMGNTYAIQNNVPQAIECYKKVMLYNCDFIPAKIKLLEIYERENQFNNANMLWDELYEIDAYLNLYNKYKSRWKHFDKAVKKRDDYLVFKKQLNSISLYCDY